MVVDADDLDGVAPVIGMPQRLKNVIGDLFLVVHWNDHRDRRWQRIEDVFEHVPAAAQQSIHTEDAMTHGIGHQYSGGEDEIGLADDPHHCHTSWRWRSARDARDTAME